VHHRNHAIAPISATGDIHHKTASLFVPHDPSPLSHPELTHWPTNDAKDGSP
jgi:hypothetical protein